MRFIDFKTHFEPFQVFSIQDIRKWDNDFDSRRLVEWQHKGYIQKVVNRWYVFNSNLTGEQLSIISNRIYSPSYISLQSALSYYQLIPEGVYTITAITTLKTHHFDTPVGSFSYQHLKPELFFGYRMTNYNGMNYKLAEPEKLILDYLYLNPSLNSVADLESVRLNVPELSTLLNLEKLKQYQQLFNNASLTKRLKLLTKNIMHA